MIVSCSLWTSCSGLFTFCYIPHAFGTNHPQLDILMFVNFLSLLHVFGILPLGATQWFYSEHGIHRPMHQQIKGCPQKFTTVLCVVI